MAQSSLSKLPVGAKFGLGFLGCVLVGAGFYFLVYDDLDKKVVTAIKETANLEAEDKLQKAAESAYFQDKNELAVREAKQKDLNRALPLEAESGSFLSTIQATSNVAGIDLKGYVPQEEQNQVFYARVPMKLEITGKFHQLAKFMYELGKTERIINVENIELNDPLTTGDDVSLKARCLATTFHLVKVAAPVAVAPAPGAAPTQPAQPSTPK
jgi:type IV pilus assembly protein PilO